MSEDSSSQPDAAREILGKMLGQMPSGVFILAAADGSGNETGMLASWVQQAAFEPPAVVVAVNKKRYLNDWLEQQPRMALSLVGESQTEFLKYFGRGFEPGAAAFEGVEITRGETGLPVLSGAMGYLEGDVTQTIDAGDHLLYLVEVVAAGTGAASAQRPMVHIRKNGFNY